MDDAFVYVVAEIDRTRVVARLPKAGGPMTTLARDVRDAPIDVEGADVLFLDATRTQLRSVPKAGGEARVVLEDEASRGVAAIVADPTTVYRRDGRPRERRDPRRRPSLGSASVAACRRTWWDIDPPDWAPRVAARGGRAVGRKRSLFST